MHARSERDGGLIGPRWIVGFYIVDDAFFAPGNCQEAAVEFFVPVPS
jgi:hypothetical protein